MTCRGFADAFERQGHLVRIMYPGNYSAITDHLWDIVGIEGWFPAITAFIHEVRRVTSDYVKVYFFCLDPDFPGLDIIQDLDVDAFFTNSHEALDILQHQCTLRRIHATRGYAITDIFNEPCAKAILGIETKRDLPTMLHEAIPFGLVIYGHAWNLYPEFAPYWRGVLPPEDLLDVYASAKVILGATMAGQRSSGMINNRVFEVLAAGSILISDHFDALERLFGDRILYYTKPGDIARHMATLAAFPHTPHDLRAFINDHHTYEHRVEQILAVHLTKLPMLQLDSRPNSPLFAVVVDHSFLDTDFLASMYVQDALIPALESLRSTYCVVFVSLADAAQATLKHGDFVLFVSCWACPLDIDARKTFPEVSVYGKGLYLLRTPMEPLPSSAADFYDVLFATGMQDEASLAHLRSHRRHAFGLDLQRYEPHAKPSGVPCEWMAVGDWGADEQRLLRITGFPRQPNATYVVVLAEKNHQDHANSIAFLESLGYRVFFATSPSQIVSRLREFQCKATFLPAVDVIGSGGDWLVSIAANMGLTLHVVDDSIRWGAVYSSKPRWDLTNGPNSLLGRANSTVRMVSPRDGAFVGRVFTVEFDTSLLDVPRDGNVCLVINNDTYGCVMHPDLKFTVAWSMSGTAGSSLSLQLVLTSNIYGNYFASAPSIQVYYAPDLPEEPRPARAYHISL
ncbi:unnamed protein product [Aphanomyces euteiches]